MTSHLGCLTQHYSDHVPCRRTQLKIARATPRRPPAIHWLINL